MKSTVTVLSALALVFLTNGAGLAATETPLDKPILDEVSPKSFEGLETCIGDKFEASALLNRRQLLSRSTTTGYRISITYLHERGLLGFGEAEIAPVYTVDMVRVASGTRVQLFSYNPSDQAREFVSGCL